MGDFMKLINYEFHDTDEANWHFSPIKLDNINLFVGDTATGKSRLLNTIFNLGASAVRKPSELFAGYWNITFIQNKTYYQWELESSKDSEEKVTINKENIWRLLENGDKEPIITRDKDTFKFKESVLPKLSKSETSILLLQDEPEIQPLYKAFTSIKRRRFPQDALMSVMQYSPISSQLYNEVNKEKSIDAIFYSNINLNGVLYLLSEFFPNIYRNICGLYREWFSFISDMTIMDITEIHGSFSTPTKIPVFCIKEKEAPGWIELRELSSGMQKVLLILTDILSFPESGIYMIDEYENSLGPSAIEFLPELLSDLEDNVQKIITSHHPYLIKKIPVKNWYVFHRRGRQVTIRYGEELIEKISASKQDAYIQLINDPFYYGGNE